MAPSLVYSEIRCTLRRLLPVHVTDVDAGFHAAQLLFSIGLHGILRVLEAHHLLSIVFRSGSHGLKPTHTPKRLDIA